MKQGRFWAVTAVLVVGVFWHWPWQAAGAEDAKTVFDSIFGERLKKARATMTKKDDIALAEDLLAATGRVKGEAALLTLMCEKAYELTSRQPDGFDVALRAAGILAETVPDRKDECQEKVLAVRKLQYLRSRGAQKRQAGEALVKVMMAVADARLEAGKASEAAQFYREARIIASALRQTDLTSAITAKLKNCADRVQVERKTQELKARLQRKPDDAAARRELILLYVVELDNPAEAKKLLTDAADQTLQTYVPLAAEEIETVAPAACLELGGWYVGLAKQAKSTGGQMRALVRAQRYYQRAVESGKVTGAAQLKVKLAIMQIEKDLLKLGYVPPGRLPVGKPVDLLQYADFNSPGIRGKATRMGPAATLKPGYKEGGALPIPVMLDGSYRVQFKVQWPPGTSKHSPDSHIGMHLSLPVGPDCHTGLGINYGSIGFSSVKGHTWSSESNPTAKALPANLKGGKAYSVEVQVVRNGDSISLAAAINGRVCTKWTGKVSVSMKGTSPRGRRLKFTGSSLSTTLIGSAKVTITSGQGLIATEKLLLAMETKAAKPITVEAKKQYVYGSLPWTAVGKVVAEEYYDLRADEYWHWGPDRKHYCGADGTKADGKFHLLGRVGEGKPFKLGRQVTFKAPATGLLRMGMSHQVGKDFSDNGGQLTVSILWNKARRPRLLTAAKTVSASATREWTDAVLVEAGKTYRITCTEHTAWRAGGLRVGPAGGKTAGKFHLQARIAGGEPFKVAGQVVFTAKASGLLELGMSHFAERGAKAYGTVRATVESGPSAPLAPTTREATPATAPATAAKTPPSGPFASLGKEPASPRDGQDLLKLLDPAKAALAGKWEVRDGVLVTSPADHGLIAVGPAPAGSYRLHLDVTRESGTEDLCVILPVGAGRCALMIDAWAGKISGLADINGMAPNDARNPARVEKRAEGLLFLPAGKKTTVDVHVDIVGRMAGVRVVIDARTIVDWRGMQSSLTLSRYWPMQSKGIALGQHNSAFRIHAVRLKQAPARSK